MTGKKGLEPIIAMVMLVVITVGAAGIIFTWTKSFTTGTQDRAERNAISAAGCSGASLLIREVYLQNGTNASARAAVQNSGYVDNLTLDFAQMFNTMGANFSAANMPMTLNRGDIEILYFTNADIPKCDNFSSITISANCGAGYDFTGTPTCVK